MWAPSAQPPGKAWTNAAGPVSPPSRRTYLDFSRNQWSDRAVSLAAVMCCPHKNWWTIPWHSDIAFTGITVYLSLLSHAGVADAWDRVISGVCDCVCVCPHSIKGKRIELSIPNLVHILNECRLASSDPEVKRWRLLWPLCYCCRLGTARRLTACVFNYNYYRDN